MARESIKVTETPYGNIEISGRDWKDVIGSASEPLNRWDAVTRILGAITNGYRVTVDSDTIQDEFARLIDHVNKEGIA